MTVRLITHVDNFIGVSGDSKPTDVPAGSTFFETNTKSNYLYDGSTWRLVPGVAS